MNNLEKKNIAIKITIYGSIIDLVLGVSKILVGVIYFSQALIIDGIHSLSDILTDIFVIIVSKYSHDHPDDKHPYGHARFETVGTILIGLILIFVAIFLVKDNLDLYFSNTPVSLPEWPTILMAIISIISKEWIYQKTVAVGKKIDSQLIIANAWHSRSDAFSSILVLISLIVSMLGYTNMDTLMAIIVSVLIGKIGWDFVWKSIVELVDTGLKKDNLIEIKKIIMSIHGVKGFHHLRSRQMANKTFLDVNIEVSPKISVSEGHEIAAWVSEKLIQLLPHVHDVTVHTDIESEKVERESHISENESEIKLLPLRDEIESIVKNFLDANEFELIEEIYIHYLKGKIHLNIFIKKDTDFSSIENKLKKSDHFEKISFFTRLNQ